MEQQHSSPMASLLLSHCNRQPLHIQGLYCNGQVQDWLSPAGQRRSLPTNCPDHPILVNNNTLRSTRCIGASRYSLSGSNPAAGNHSSACTLVDNWTEDQTDRSKYTPKTQYRLQPTQKSTEYRAEISTSAAHRLQQARLRQLQQCYIAGGSNSSSRAKSASSALNIKSPESKASTSLIEAALSERGSIRPRSSTSRRSSSACEPALNWQEQQSQHHGSHASCKTSLRQRSLLEQHSNSSCSRATDQQQYTTLTASSGRASGGVCWSAPGSCESIAATAARRQKLEFQAPASGDARACVLGISSSSKERDASLAAACRVRLEANKALTQHWASMYRKEYLQQQWVASVEATQGLAISRT